MLSTQVINKIFNAWMPPPKLTVSDWADQNRELSPESSAEQGKWRTSRAEYQRGIMNAVNDPDIEVIVFISSSQVGKTEIINNIAGYYIDNDPSPILLIQPTIDMAQAYSKDRFATMIRDTPALREKVKSPRAKDSSNTILHKKFPGGHITIAGANSPASLASRPIRIVLLDEIDRYPASAGAEGDPVSLAIKRSTTFWNRLHVLISTPTIKGLSRIEAAFNESDQRYYYVPCHNCKKYQRLFWANVQWEKDHTGKHLPETAYYKCEYCGAHWTDAQRHAAVRNGKWQATKPEVKKIAGFHISELYSTWVSLSDMVENFLNAKGNPERLKTFVNLSLGEPWEDEAEKVDDNELLNRCEIYPEQVPHGGLVLTAGIDVQNDRIEGEVVAWGVGEESWSVDLITIHGNPAESHVWDDLDKRLQKVYRHESGINLKISCTCIDSGGHHTDQVYKFVKGKDHRRIFAIKGSSTAGQPIINRPSKSNKGRVKLFTIGTDTAKEIIFARLKIDDPGAGYMHFNKKINDEEYFKQLTAEKAQTKYQRGFPYRVWVKIRERNEMLDCRVYALAALRILNPQFDKIAESLKKIADELQQVEIKKTETPPKKPAKRNWINKWKG